MASRSKSKGIFQIVKHRTIKERFINPKTGRFNTRIVKKPLFYRRLNLNKHEQGLEKGANESVARAPVHVEAPSPPSNEVPIQATLPSLAVADKSTEKSFSKPLYRSKDLPSKLMGKNRTGRGHSKGPPIGQKRKSSRANRQENSKRVILTPKIQWTDQQKEEECQNMVKGFHNAGNGKPLTQYQNECHSEVNLANLAGKRVTPNVQWTDQQKEEERKKMVKIEIVVNIAAKTALSPNQSINQPTPGHKPCHSEVQLANLGNVAEDDATEGSSDALNGQTSLDQDNSILEYKEKQCLKDFHNVDNTKPPSPGHKPCHSEVQLANLGNVAEDDAMEGSSDALDGQTSLDQDNSMKKTVTVNGIKFILASFRKGDTGAKTTLCPVCSKPYSRMNALMEHLERHPNSTGCEVHCGKCRKSFTQRDYLATHEGELSCSTKCPMCDLELSWASNLAEHVARYHNEKRFKCALCDKSFYHHTGLRRHSASHAPVKKYFHCDVCHKYFLDKSKLQRHQLIHEGKQPFQCLRCSKRFMKKENLQLHIKNHDKAPGCVCEGCGRIFVKPIFLMKHQNKNECKYSGPMRTLCIQGIKRVVTSEYSCSFCSQHFEKKRLLEEHLIAHAFGDDQYPITVRPTTEDEDDDDLDGCESCISGFKSRKALFDHLFSHM